MQWQVKTRLWGRCIPGPDWISGMVKINRIYYIHSGIAHYECNGARKQLLPGHLYLFPEHIRMLTDTDAVNPLDHTFLDFDVIPGLYLKEITCIRIADYPLIQKTMELFDELLRYYGENRYCSEALSMADSNLQNLLQIISNVIRMNTLCDERILETMLYIQEHLQEELSIEHLASRLYLDKHYFIRLFSRHTGDSPHNYIRNQRLNRAGSLILKGNPAKDVAEKCGYDSYCAFSRAFKEYYRCPPTKYLERETSLYQNHF